MTHFVVFVIGENVEEQLAPFDEELEVPEYKDADGKLTTYNPDSHWDWWVIGGRWKNTLILRDDRQPLTNEAAAGEVDWDAMWAAGRFPVAIVGEGTWQEVGRIGWFGAVDRENELSWNERCKQLFSHLSPDVLVTLVDCHV